MTANYIKATNFLSFCDYFSKESTILHINCYRKISPIFLSFLFLFFLFFLFFCSLSFFLFFRCYCCDFSFIKPQLQCLLLNQLLNINRSCFASCPSFRGETLVKNVYKIIIQCERGNIVRRKENREIGGVGGRQLRWRKKARKRERKQERGPRNKKIKEKIYERSHLQSEILMPKQFYSPCLHRNLYRIFFLSSSPFFIPSFISFFLSFVLFLLYFSVYFSSFFFLVFL